MSNYAKGIIEYGNVMFLPRAVIQRTLSIAGTIYLTFCSTTVQAQSNPSGSIDNTSPNIERLSPIESIGQQNLQQDFYPSSGGSQQFFRQGSDRLYFLPAEKSEPILKIDKTVEAEGVNYEDLQGKPVDK